MEVDGRDVCLECGLMDEWAVRLYENCCVSIISIVSIPPAARS